MAAQPAPVAVDWFAQVVAEAAPELTGEQISHLRLFLAPKASTRGKVTPIPRQRSNKPVRRAA